MEQINGVEIPGYQPPTKGQKGLYWIWMGVIADALELKKDHVHEMIKTMLNEGKSTSSLHTIQFTSLMSSIRKWAEAYEIYLPEGEYNE